MLKLSRFKHFLWCQTVTALAAVLLLSPSAFAQSGIYLVPTAAVEEVYDDNIFFDTEDEIADYFTRVSLQLDLGFESETLNWLASYRNDAEWYKDLSDLDSTTARRFGVAEFDYQLNRRWKLFGNAEYTETNSVQDLTLVPGGGIPGRVGRDEAERLLFAGGTNYQFSPAVNADFRLSWVKDDLDGLLENISQAAQADFEQVLNPARSLVYGYLYRDYSFESDDSVDPGFTFTDSEDSHTAWIGLKQAISETSSLELRAGPRVNDGDLEPYFLFNWQRSYARGNTVIEALWDETTLLGEVGSLESRSLSATWTHSFSSKMEFSGSAGYAYLSGTGFSADIASLDLSGIYRFNPAIFLTARYGFNTQQDDPVGVPIGRITHNVISLAITFTRPRRDTDRSSS